VVRRKRGKRAKRGEQKAQPSIWLFKRGGLQISKEKIEVIIVGTMRIFPRGCGSARLRGKDAKVVENQAIREEKSIKKGCTRGLSARKEQFMHLLTGRERRGGPYY